ncbi:hypothetical protein [Xylophilus sp. Leaf220]|uniref:hypothetical protein n=1 Tax=Xylophilus sp. Leaf220 TaxID=1735686 RepID=UPI0012E26EC9|nr:hypothetical protein [Xylophilus sp. Leaf220]
MILIEAKVLTMFNIPDWFGPLDSSKYLVASMEPSGLLLGGNIELLLFQGWVTKFCAKRTLALGHEVYDAEI